MRLPMSVSIQPVSPSSTEAVALLRASHALMEALFPPEENHYLDVDELSAPGVSFFAAESGGALLGCVALQRHDGYGEVKSLFVAPEARGLGMGALLLSHVERVAAEEGLPIIRLETGDKLRAAGELYKRSGYRTIGPFGDYTAAGSSVFYEKHLENRPRLTR